MPVVQIGDTVLNTNYVDLFTSFYDDEKESHWSINHNKSLLLSGTTNTFSQSKVLASDLLEKMDESNCECIIGDTVHSKYYGALSEDWILYMGYNGMGFLAKRKHIKMFKKEGETYTITYMDYKVMINVPRHVDHEFKRLMIQAMV